MTSELWGWTKCGRTTAPRKSPTEKQWPQQYCCGPLFCLVFLLKLIFSGYFRALLLTFHAPELVTSSHTCFSGYEKTPIEIEFPETRPCFRVKITFFHKHPFSAVAKPAAQLRLPKRSLLRRAETCVALSPR